MDESKVKKLFDDALSIRRAELYRPHIPVKSLADLAMAYHYESDWYTKIALRWVRGGIITLVAIAVASVWINKEISLHNFPESIWLSVNALILILSLYIVQVIGKQIVASREIIFAFTERGKLVQAIDCAIRASDNVEKNEKLYIELIERVANKLPSPFENDKVAGKANLDFLRDLSALAKSRKAP